jgi:hypothetical protein
VVVSGRQKPILIASVLVAALLVTYAADESAGSDPGVKPHIHVEYLADDSLEGRLPGTPGIEKAAAYIAGFFGQRRMEPAFDGSYFQEFEITLGVTVTEGPFLRFGEAPQVPQQSIAVVPISGSGGLTGMVVRGLPEEDGSGGSAPDGSVVLIEIPSDIEDQRWTMMGRDGLLEYMRDEAARAEELGAAAVVFVGESPDRTDSGLHHFPLRRSYRQVGIPVIEMSGVHCADARTCSLSLAVEPRSISVKNIGAIIRGSTRPEEYVIVGAHYDHLGYGDIASSTPWRREIHNGADDNASGVAALLEIANWTAIKKPTPRTFVFLAFTAEELGALGSEYYCKNPPFPIENTIAMVNLDTIGRMEDNKLIVFGARSAEEMSDVLRSKPRYGMEIVEKDEIYGFSDQNPFYARGVPSLHFFTGAYDDYHSPDDDIANVNFGGLSDITVYVARVARKLASIDSLTPVIDAEEPSPPEMSRGSGAFLGIVPDFAYSGTGVGLKGTVPVSPAEAAGLQDGDVIVSINGKTIADLRALMHFLAAGKPGDEIEIQIMRGSAPAVKHATLSVRSSRGHSD